MSALVNQKPSRKYGYFKVTARYVILWNTGNSPYRGNNHCSSWFSLGDTLRNRAIDSTVDTTRVEDYVRCGDRGIPGVRVRGM